MTNLCAVATPSVVELNDLGQDAWDLARPDLSAALAGAGAVLGGWGVGGLMGEARRYLETQVAWLNDEVRAAGLSSFWMVGGEPRHPSRWHQYVSDKYDRTSGGTFDQRIQQVLIEVPIGQRFSRQLVALDGR